MPRVTQPISHNLCLASHNLCNTPYVSRHTTYITHPMSRITQPMQHNLCLASHNLCHTTYVSRHDVMLSITTFVVQNCLWPAIYCLLVRSERDLSLLFFICSSLIWYLSYTPHILFIIIKDTEVGTSVFKADVVDADGRRNDFGEVLIKIEGGNEVCVQWIMSLLGSYKQISLERQWARKCLGLKVKKLQLA